MKKSWIEIILPPAIYFFERQTIERGTRYGK
jgi:hypothetical protein